MQELCCYAVSVAQTIPFPTPADVKAEPLTTKWIDLFAAVPDVRVQRYIDSAAEKFGSPEVLQHTQRNEAVLYAACHMIALRLMAEGAASSGGGSGGLAGPLSSVKLDGAASKSFAVKALDPEDVGDMLKQKTPFLTELMDILKTFPPGIFVTNEGAVADGSFLTAPSLALW